MKLRNKKLIEINKSYKDLSNKELSNTLITLGNDFEKIKVYLLELTSTMEEFEQVYNNVYNELEDRLKFKGKK